MNYTVAWSLDWSGFLKRLYLVLLHEAKQVKMTDIVKRDSVDGLDISHRSRMGKASKMIGGCNE